MKLLFILAQWHGLAKLKLHTEGTLELLANCTKELGMTLRNFKATTCKAFVTIELQREAEIRERRAQRKAAAKKSAPKTAAPADVPSQGSPSREMLPSASSENAPAAFEPTKQRKPKELNLNTIKVHFLGDYVPTIRSYGTADSYSTQAVSFS